MGQTVSFLAYTPPARFDAVSWTDAQIEEAPAPGGPWTIIDTVSVTIDVDPADPQPRDFTTTLGTAPDLWYRVVFLDAALNLSEPSAATHNTEAADDGPVCQDWITGDDVADCCGSTFGTDVPLDVFASEAVALLFELSGGRFTGVCERTVRPCPGSCGCWGTDPLARYIGTTALDGFGFGLDGYWRWGNGHSGCAPLSTVKLAGYPVQEILEVTIDGDVIDPSEYRLLRGRDLVRLADSDGNRQLWPGCQRLDLPAGDPGTFTVEYTYGQAPPVPAIEAAKQLACQLALACPDPNGDTGECDLPAGTVQVIRQGITVNVQTLGLFLTRGETGLAHVDAFLATYGGRSRRPAVILSPDVTRYAQEA